VLETGREKLNDEKGESAGKVSGEGSREGCRGRQALSLAVLRGFRGRIRYEAGADPIATVSIPSAV